jgi:hypothetical protein
MLWHVGTAMDVAQRVVERMGTAREVLNTFIVWDDPYSPEVADRVELAIQTYVSRSDTRYEETCSTLGMRRIENIRQQLGGSLPRSCQVRVLKSSASNVPVCNFVILTHKEGEPIHEEVFFGWGYFRGSANESVFWSDDPALIRFFRDYHRSLRASEVSEELRATV